MRKAVIIGSGVAGLATALRLRKRGFDVTVLEAQAQTGGKAKRITKEGFTWGYGPSLLTMPHLIDELFTYCGKNPSDYYEYVRLDPLCKYFFDDGAVVYAWADLERFAESFQQAAAEPKQNIHKHLQDIFFNYRLTEDIFLKKSVHKLSTYLNYKAFRALLNVHRLGIFTSMNASLEKRFKTPHAVQFFNRYATYNGSNPYRCPATLNVIAAPEYLQGGYMLSNGMPQLIEAMTTLAHEMGVNFCLHTKAEKIEIQNNKAAGVWANGKFYPGDVVVSNMDVQFTYDFLLNQSPKPKRILSQPRSTSAVIFYWGMNRSFSQLDVHNILFSSNYKEEFRHKGELKTIYKDPTVYIFISSKINSSHAPPGCENWFVLVNAPFNCGQDWESLKRDTRASVIRKVKKLLGEDIENNIVTEHVNTPVNIEQDTFSYLGSLYGNSSDNPFSAFLRHPNFSSAIPNLFFCGGSVHPGGGVPLCLLSAKIIDELVR
ncbi:MAG: 1-hydroxycarotenoid 3,4-desaturase CrtD [Chitinophagales bacterium]|nr:1-hydroxycarotenoid 3,4-desaturase CrtD [Chitinophagales bacterium]